MKKRLLLLFSLSYFFIEVGAQRDIKLNQSWLMPSLYNPAMAGSTQFLEAGLGGRWQQAGQQDAPIMVAATAHMPLSFWERTHGVGIAIGYEKVGIHSNTMIGFQYAFQLKVGKGKLHLSLQPGVVFDNFKGSKYKAEEDTLSTHLPYPFDDGKISKEKLPTQDILGKQFDLSMGVMYFFKSWYVGASCTHLFTPTFHYSDSCEARLQPHLYIMFGGTSPKGFSPWQVAPFFLCKGSPQNWTIEGSCRVIWKERFWLGAGYRYKEGPMFYAGAKVKGISIAYSYDYLSNFSIEGKKGSHELVLRYSFEIKNNKKREDCVQSIRFL